LKCARANAGVFVCPKKFFLQPAAGLFGHSLELQ
jgi:hypothetical protein